MILGLCPSHFASQMLRHSVCPLLVARRPTAPMLPGRLSAPTHSRVLIISKPIWVDTRRFFFFFLKNLLPARPIGKQIQSKGQRGMRFPCSPEPKEGEKSLQPVEVAVWRLRVFNTSAGCSVTPRGASVKHKRLLVGVRSQDGAESEFMH